MTKLFCALYLKKFRQPFDLSSLGLNTVKFSYLTEQELEQWDASVETYSAKVRTIIEASEKVGTASFLYSMLNFINWQSDNLFYAHVPQDISASNENDPFVDILHTGSIPERFGKPLMPMESLDDLTAISYEHVHSDHDMMLEMLKYPVRLTQLPISSPTDNYSIKHLKGKDLVWKFELVAHESSISSEYVNIQLVGKEENLKATFSKIIPNTLARSYLLNRIQLANDEFLKTDPGSKKKRQKMEVKYQGPAVNINVTSECEKIFDADLLLSLPVSLWPRYKITRQGG